MVYKPTKDKRRKMKTKNIQQTLEQHRFELCGSTYTWIFLNKYLLQ